MLFCFFIEVFERIQSLRAFLNFIEDDQCFSRQNLLSADHGEQFNNALRVLVCLEDGFQLIFFVKVEIDEAPIAVLSKLLHQPRFADLSCTSQNEGLSLLIAFPIDHILNRIAFHGSHRPFRG